MDRPIKFMGKPVDGGDWVYGNLVWLSAFKSPFIIPVISSAGYDGIIKEWSFGDCIKVIPESVGQFTGLKDKNGKEIYEGHILEVKFDERYTQRVSWRGKPDAIAEVYWDYCALRLHCKGEKDKRYASFYDFVNNYLENDDYLMMNLEHVKIIGTVTDNPELIKAKS